MSSNENSDDVPEQRQIVRRSRVYNPRDPSSPEPPYDPYPPGIHAQAGCATRPISAHIVPQALIEPIRLHREEDELAGTSSCRPVPQCDFNLGKFPQVIEYFEFASFRK